MKQILYKTAAWWAVLGGVLALIISVVTMVNVTAFGLDRLARHFGENVPAIIGYEDFVSLLVSCAVLMFFPYCQTRHGHVAVDVFMKLFPAGFGRIVQIISSTLMTLLAGFLAWMMFNGLFEVRGDNTLSSILGWQIWPFYVPGILSLILWTLISASQIFEKEDQHV
ncbi:TRAP transporter small permease [Thalassospira sp.]|uniref:TRAP transporter small permease n=1 Tax=Thalassospira sp. TaxID=1912094 RepID=UPI0027358500|nr:TRAP transporter small permease [Thalassospira sp.]MDP2697665.1 TRAP transporter small permease [Thalassospira sp.]